MELNNITGRRVNSTRIWPNDDCGYAIPGAITTETNRRIWPNDNYGCEIPGSITKNNYTDISTVVAKEKFTPTPRDITVPNFVADTVALRRVYIFCGMLLTLLVISSVTIGILTHSLMMRADATETKTDELQTDVNNLQDEVGHDPSSLTELQTKLMEIETRLDDYKTGIDSKFLEYLSKITQLETDRNIHATLIQDHLSKITQLELEVKTNHDDVQKIDEGLSILETDRITDEATSNKLNETVTQLAIDILANEESIQNQKTQLNEIVSDIDQSINEMVSVYNILNTLEANISMQSSSNQDHEYRISQLEKQTNATDKVILNLDARIVDLETNLTLEQIVSDQDQNSRILQLEIGSNMTDESIQNLVKRVANLETNMTAKQLFSQNLDANLTKMSTNIFSNEEEILKLKTQITEIEVGNGVDQGEKSAFAIVGVPAYNSSTNVAIFPSGALTTNVESQYNTTTGQFICQRAGLYVFILNLYKQMGNRRLSCGIRKNGESVVRADVPAGSDYGYFSSSGSTVLHLEPGDSIDVGYCGIAKDIMGSTSFIGFLLHAD